jgi:toxin ParE1/3/4
MKVIFQRSAAADVRWYSGYYRRVFPEGMRKGRLQLDKALRALADNPRIGHPIEGTAEREFSVARTPFCLIYRVSASRIEILRLWDQRREEADKYSDSEGNADE